MTVLILATRNAHKVREIENVMGASFRCLAMSRFVRAPDLTETGATFGENATAKADSLTDWLTGDPARLDEFADASQVFVLADDSGLEVDALNGAPGIHSARFAALGTATSSNSSDADNNAKLLRLLKDVPLERRTARFRCVLALIPVGGANATARREVFQGTCEGRIALTPAGQHGFGYDPLFIPNGYRKSFGELEDSVKNQISHRARALAELRRQSGMIK